MQRNHHEVIVSLDKSRLCAVPKNSNSNSGCNHRKTLQSILGDRKRRRINHLFNTHFAWNEISFTWHYNTDA